MNGRQAISDIAQEIEFVERLASVTEELGDLVEISKGKKKMDSPTISKRDVQALLKGSEREAGMQKSLLSVFKLLVVKNLIRGRLFSTAYNSGKEIGLNVTTRSKKDFIKAARRLGMSKITISRFEPKHIKIKLEGGGLTALGVTRSRRPICFFEAGLFVGFLENIFRKKIDLKETRCRAMGHSCCQFESGSLEDHPQRPGSLYPLEAYSQENLKLLTSLASHSIAAIENAIMFEKTRRQSVIDGLTQVYNHRYFQTRIDVEFKRAQRYNTPLTLFMLDVDNFKNFNTRHGHPKGDEAIKAVAAGLRSSLRDVDIVARYGGDEFAVILPQTGENGARIVADRIRKEVSKRKISLRKSKIGITISLGGVTVGPSILRVKASALVETADKALLRAKKKGKNNIVLLRKV